MYANSKSHDLISHQIAVAKVAVAFAKNLGVSDPEIIRSIFLAAYFHDTGKAISFFQDYMDMKILYPVDDPYYSSAEYYDDKVSGITKQRLNAYPRHHEISWATLASFFKGSKFSIMLHSIYWHHAKPVDDKGLWFTNDAEIRAALPENERKAILSHIAEMIDRLKDVNEEYYNYISSEYKEDTDKYKEAIKVPPLFYTENAESLDSDLNAISLIARFCVATSDRKVSTITASEVEMIANSERDPDLYALSFINLRDKPSDTFTARFCPDHYDKERFNLQESCAVEASKHRCSVVKAPAGFGKSNIAVQFSILCGSGQTFIYTPRNSIAAAVYESIVDELNSMNIRRTVECYYEGDQQKCNVEGIKPFGADIVVTNIDNLLNPTFSNKHATQFQAMLSSTAIFDEFHELFIKDNAMLGAFVTFMRARMRYCTNSRTMLMSATPVPMWMLWDVYDNNSVVLPNASTHYPAMHNKEYTITVVNDIPAALPKNAAMFFNSIKASQAVHSDLGSDELVHGKFFISTKTGKLQRIRGWFNKHADKNVRNSKSVISAKMIQAAEDISFSSLYIARCSIRSFFQILGRGNRFGHDDTCNVSYMVIPKEHVVKRSEDSAALIAEDKDILSFWDSFAQDLFETKQEWTLNELYVKYNEFYSKYDNDIKSSMRDWYKDSMQILSKFDMTVSKKKIKDSIRSDLIIKIKRAFGLRECGGYFYTIRHRKSGRWVPFENVFSASNVEFMTMLDKESEDPYKKAALFRDLIADGYESFNDKGVLKAIEKSKDKKKTLKGFAKNGEMPFPIFNKVYDDELGIIDL